MRRALERPAAVVIREGEFTGKSSTFSAILAHEAQASFKV
jgi:hypothetical protein